MIPVAITKGIQERVPEEIIEFLLFLTMKRVVESEIDTDYLQIFKLSISEELPSMQLIQHRQEKPELIENHFLPLIKPTPCEEEIYILPNEIGIAVLLAEEY
ncbi:DUF960 family protein [Enterococcus termitis]|uniref:Uncharacterized protein n=1 Tax=Enterococcus termitis TaxID=332950 RepID=A0A1E5GJI2_9ENTE|nr:DUF960 family protein [Enterococcus termitis]OEG12852.1 hypothetical protein BCR25_04985 [Enterococcus termitis]OJG96497.1 hypothetical protein RV18_GL002445 [Enterococcus termitis]